MKVYKYYFLTSLCLLFFYELAMIGFKLDGFTFHKAAITSLIWISAGLALFTFNKQFSTLKKDIPRYAFKIYGVLLVWNFFNIGRSVIFQAADIATLFGHTRSVLALLAPFALSFSIYDVNIQTLNRYLHKILLGVSALFFIILIIPEVPFEAISQRDARTLCFPLIFLISGLIFEKKTMRFFIIASSILFFFFAFVINWREMMLYLILLYSGLIATYLCFKTRSQWMLHISFFTTIAISLIIPISHLSHQSLTSIISSELTYYTSPTLSPDASKMFIDNRTFLYDEVIDDLARDKQLIIGRGAHPAYFSPYFTTVTADSAHRLDVEAGILSILLRGGIIAVVINLAILSIAVYLAFYQSQNHYTVGVGYIVLTHTIMLFFSSNLGYSSCNFILWFFVGVCFSHKFRNMNNQQINGILFNES